MAINGVGYSPVENVNSIYNEQKKLDTSNIINVKDIADKNRDILKDVKLKSDKIDLSKLTLAKEEEDSVQIKLNNDYDKSSTNEFDSFIHNMKGLSKDEKASLKTAINAAADTLNGQRDSNTYGMRIAQTNMEFKYISQKIVPKEYQDKFNAIAEEYTQKQSDSFVFFEKCFAENLMNRTDSLSTQMGWQKKGREWKDSIENGTDDFQSSEKSFESSYNRVDLSDSSKVKDQLDNVYKNILSNGGNSYNKADLSREIKYLSEKWNGVMDAIGEKNNKFTTSVNYLI